MKGKVWFWTIWHIVFLLSCAEVNLERNDDDTGVNQHPLDTNESVEDTDFPKNTPEEKDTDTCPATEDSESSDNNSTLCGNNQLDTGEDCDDGNRDAGDGCSPNCTVEHCGDGMLNPAAVSSHLEDFETGQLTEWIQGPDYGFELTSEHVHGGTYAIQPANGGVSSSSAEVSIEAYTDGTICFWFYGRSSNNWLFDDYDYLYFYIDGNKVKSWLGTHTSWKQYCATTSPGWKKITWKYEKDASGSSFIDSYLIDDVRFAEAYQEQCDDGNNTSNDGCSATCQTE